jgi:hypothetical protein
MSNINKPPALIDRYLCVVNRDALALAAVISSWLFEKGSYLPLFMFPPVTAGRMNGDDVMGETYLSNLLGNETGVFINNAWARIGGSEYLILAALSRDQKSYLTIPRGTKVIEIDDPSELPTRLAPLMLPERAEMRCKTLDILEGLFVAQSEGKRLAIDEQAEAVHVAPKNAGGIVIVENTCDARALIGVNYASSVGASVLVVPPVTKDEAQEAHRSLYDWKRTGDDAHLAKVKDSITARMHGIVFREFEYATFFTEGLPYSFVITNAVPCSYVHLSLKPDLFVFNCIVFEHINTFHSAVVFSPAFFPDEETKWLAEFFKRNHYYLRPLIGREASFAHLDFNAQHFPYGVLHICSHGGEVDGWAVSEEFVDRNGKTHVIEYDEVVGHDSVPNKDGRICVHRKTIFRRLDGFEWMSTELEEQNIPLYVFHDMQQALRNINTNAKRTKVGRIPSSCAIRCFDTIHQGELSILASHSSPLVFNNTCWSWYEVAKFFLACGARGYIGTLWAIDNVAAIRGAQAFYDNVFSGTVLDAFEQALKAVVGTQSKDIYVYWGLHFTTLSRAVGSAESRSEVFGELLQALGGWKRKIRTARSAEVRENSMRVLQAIVHELNANFGQQDIEKLEQEMQARPANISRNAGSEVDTDGARIVTRSSMEHPTEYRSADEDAE